MAGITSSLLIWFLGIPIFLSYFFPGFILVLIILFWKLAFFFIYFFFQEVKNNRQWLLGLNGRFDDMIQNKSTIFGGGKKKSMVVLYFLVVGSGNRIGCN